MGSGRYGPYDLVSRDQMAKFYSHLCGGGSAERFIVIPGLRLRM